MLLADNQMLMIWVASSGWFLMTGHWDPTISSLKSCSYTYTTYVFVDDRGKSVSASFFACSPLGIATVNNWFLSRWQTDPPPSTPWKSDLQSTYLIWRRLFTPDTPPDIAHPIYLGSSVCIPSGWRANPGFSDLLKDTSAFRQEEVVIAQSTLLENDRTIQFIQLEGLVVVRAGSLSHCHYLTWYESLLILLLKL